MGEKKLGRGELKVGEPHPAYDYALSYIAKKGRKELYMLLESFSSCAIENNRLAEICAETLDRLLHARPVSDRYLMGLAWAIWGMDELKKSK